MYIYNSWELSWEFECIELARFAYESLTLFYADLEGNVMLQNWFVQE